MRLPFFEMHLRLYRFIPILAEPIIEKSKLLVKAAKLHQMQQIQSFVSANAILLYVKKYISFLLEEFRLISKKTTILSNFWLYFQPNIVYNQKKTEFFSSRLQKEGAFMSHITKHLGSRIRFYRKILGLTIDDLADAIHKSKSTVSKYEAGLVGLDIDTLFDIAGALQVSVNQLIDCPEPSPQNIFISKGFFSQPRRYN